MNLGMRKVFAHALRFFLRPGHHARPFSASPTHVYQCGWRRSWGKGGRKLSSGSIHALEYRFREVSLCRQDQPSLVDPACRQMRHWIGEIERQLRIPVEAAASR